MNKEKIINLIEDLIEAYDFVTMRTIFESMNPAYYNIYLNEIKEYLKNRVDKGELFLYNYQYWKYKLKPITCKNCNKVFWVKPSVKGVHFCNDACMKTYYKKVDFEERKILGVR